MLTKAAHLAIQKLAGENKFDDKSVKITIVDNVLTVRRLRPNKIILSATKDENGEWKSIGVPNIDPLKDLKILEDVAKVENEVAQVIQADETAKQQPQKIKPRSRSNELR